MKKSITFAILLIMLASCNDGQTVKQLQMARDSISSLSLQVKDLNNQVKVLKFPADQRLTEIQKLVVDGKFDNARKKIAELKECFPKSTEAGECEGVLMQIAEREAAVKAEQDRIKALGFKAFSSSQTAEIGYNKVVFSAPTIGGTYIHDICSDVNRKEEEIADRGKKYIVMQMTVTSSSKDAKIPTASVYTIEGDKLELYDSFKVNFVRWSDYSYYIDSSQDDRTNDFSKVSTVKFTLGCEVSEDVLSKPYAIVLKKANTLWRSKRDLPWPVTYYEGDSGYPTVITLKDFTEEYQIIKLANL